MLHWLRQTILVPLDCFEDLYLYSKASTKNYILKRAKIGERARNLTYPKISGCSRSKYRVFGDLNIRQWSDREEIRSSRDADRLLWRRIWLLWGLHIAPIPLSNWICPKLPDEGLCETPLTAEYRGESVSWMLLPNEWPMPSDLSWSPIAVGLSGIFTLESPGEQRRIFVIW